jgi:two-component system sensor kinase FixL
MTPNRTLPSRARDHPGQLIEAALDEVADMVAICDSQGRLVFFNPAARGLAVDGVAGSTLDPATWGDWFDADDRPVPPEDWPLRRALRGERVEVEGYRLEADGTRSWMLLSAAPIRDAGGVILGAIATSKDISRRKEVEARTRAQNEELARRVGARTAAFEALQRDLAREVRDRLDAAELLERSRRLLQEILDRTPAIIYVKDTAFRYFLVNAQFERTLGVTNAEVAGRSDYDFFPREAVAQWRANDERVLATGEPLHCEEEVLMADGLHTYVSVKFPLRDDDGALYGVCGISTEITERKAAEAELRRSRTTLSAVIESSGDAIFLVDRGGGLVLENAVAARLLDELAGGDPSGPAGAPLGPYRLLGDRWPRLLARALGGDRLTSEEVVRVGGRPRHLLLSLNPIRDGAGIGRVTVFVKDITELRQAEEQASRHQAELAHVLRLHTVGEVAASLAHEVNQPLGAIANYAQGVCRRLAAGTIADSDLHHAMTKIAHEALRAGEITRWVRALVRKDEPRRELAEVDQIVTAALAIIDPSARERGSDVRFHCDGGLPAVEVDRIQIEQVVLNLVLNALDAVEAETGRREVEVRATACGGHEVEVAVRDTGPGLDPALLERIFEPFYTTKENGLGMGLAISRAIVDAHEGRLSAAADPGGGAIFRIVLPAARGRRREHAP